MITEALTTDATSSLPSTACVTFTVPLDDTDQSAFHSLPRTVRDDVDRTLLALEEIHSAPKVNPACKAIAGSLAFHRPISWHRLRAKYYAYIRTGGDWRTLVDWTRVKKQFRPNSGTSDAEALPPEFVAHLKGLMGGNQRKSEPAIRKLYDAWKRGASIPGYGTWQEWFQAANPHEPLPRRCPPDLPRGWSRGNLRRYIPEPSELALTRSGVADALRHLPDILTTREGLRPLEYVMFDDVRTDFRILVPGYASPVVLHCLVALDLATGMVLRYGMRPAIERADGMEDRLKLRDMKALVAGVLLQYGIPRNYTMNLVVENATAAIRDSFAAALAELARSRQGGISVHRTQMICGTGIWSGYHDRASGNPQGKAALESTFNLFHNEAAFLPGQTGRRYDAGPAELHGRTADTVALSRTAKHLSPHDRARLKYPFLNYSQARVVMTDLWNQICRREDHQMEGFQVIGEWRLKEFEQWRPETELDRDPSQVLWRNPARRETPRERWTRLCSLEQPFVKFHPAAVARLYEEHKWVPVGEYEIVFDYDKTAHSYRLANLVGASHKGFKTGDKVLAYFDPHDLAVIHLTDGAGAYLGSIPETRGARRTDKAAFKAEFERKLNDLRGLQDRVNSRLPEQHEERLETIDHNAQVLSEALANADAIDVDSAALQPEPEYSRDITRAKLAAQVTARQAAARNISPVPTDDCTPELLAREAAAKAASTTQTAEEWQ